MRLLMVICLIVPAYAGDKPTLWVGDFTNETGTDLKDVEAETFFKGLHSSLAVKLASSYKVVERDKMNRSFDEFTLKEDGLLKDGSGPKLGKFTGASYLLTGSIIAYDTKAKSITAHDTTTNLYTITMVMTYKLIDIESGELHHGNEIEVQETIRNMQGRIQVQTGTIRKLSRICADKVSRELKTYLKEHMGAGR